MIDLAILGALAGRDMHGYEVAKQLPELVGSSGPASYGSIYPALSRLERNGHVHAVVPPAFMRTSVPMTGSLAGERAALAAHPPANGRHSKGRKVFRITASGRDELHRLLLAADGVEDEGEFELRVALFAHLDWNERVAVLTSRRVHVSKRITVLTDTLPANPANHLQSNDLWRQARRSRELSLLTAETAWLDEALEQLERQRPNQQFLAVPHREGDQSPGRKS